MGHRQRAPRTTRLAELPLERDVSALIGAMPFAWLEVSDAPGAASDRAYLERNCIALLSNFVGEPIDKPSDGWLGLHSPQETIRKSGLWNTNHVGDEYSPAFLDVLEKYVREAGPAASGSRGAALSAIIFLYVRTLSPLTPGRSSRNTSSLPIGETIGRLDTILLRPSLPRSSGSTLKNQSGRFH